MLKDEFEHLIEAIQRASEGKMLEMQEVIKQTVVFLDHFSKEFAKASPEEKKDLMQMMMRMNKEIMEESKKILKNTGLSEDQLLAYAENPSNYSPEQWKQFQDSKRSIQKAGMEFYHQVQKQLPSGHPMKPHSVQPLEKKEQPKVKKVRRTDWTPS